jgi:hypothetical protein
MNPQVLVPAILISLLSGCGQEQQPAVHQEKTFGGQLGDSYKGMLDEAKQGADKARLTSAKKRSPFVNRWQR